MAAPIIHLNIPSTDLADSQRFYGTVFGWTFTPNADTYVLFNDGGHGGGFSMNTKMAPEGGVLLFIRSEDIDKTLKAIEKQGGSVVSGQAPTGAGGFYAVFRDPQGNLMGLATPH